jgi:hypothetical protein
LGVPLFFIVVLGGNTLWHLQNFLQCIKYIILELTPSSTLYLPLPPSWNSFNRYHFISHFLIRSSELFP